MLPGENMENEKRYDHPHWSVAAGGTVTIIVGFVIFFVPLGLPQMIGAAILFIGFILIIGGIAASTRHRALGVESKEPETESAQIKTELDQLDAALRTSTEEVETDALAKVDVVLNRLGGPSADQGAQKVELDEQKAETVEQKSELGAQRIEPSDLKSKLDELNALLKYSDVPLELTDKTEIQVTPFQARRVQEALGEIGNFSAIPSEAIDKDTILRLGNFCYLRGLAQQALDTYDAALKIEPKYAYLWNDKGVVLTALGKSEEAVRCLEEALSIDPTHATTWQNKADALSKLGRSEDVVGCYDEVLKIEPKSVQAWNSKGAALRKLGRFEEAEKCYDEALKIEPTDFEAWNGKGVALGKLGKFEEAVACYEEALKTDSQLTRAWYNKSVVLGKLGRFEDVIRCYDEVLKIDKEDIDAWIGKSVALITLRRFDEAIECCDRALIINPKNELAAKIKKLAEESTRSKP
jgi:tetratricopeptide (TPR) repeat protein